MAEEKKRLHIRLHVYDTDIPVTIMPEDEPYCRNAARLITERVKTSRSEKEILYMAMLDIAIGFELEKTNNDTEPYDNILTSITNEIEDALGVRKPASDTREK